MSTYLDWLEVPKAKRVGYSGNLAFFTNRQYSEIVMPLLTGQNVITLKDFEKRFLYATAHITSSLLRNCIEWKVPAELVLGPTTAEGAQEKFKLFDGEKELTISTLVRGGIMFVNGDLFTGVYFTCPSNFHHGQIMAWLRTMGKVLR